VKVGIIGRKDGWHVKSLQAALARRGISAPQLPITRLTARVSMRPRMSNQDERLEDYDILFVRAIPGGSLEQIIFRVDALHRLENIGVRVINSATTIERTVDKFYTSTLLEDAGLPTPRSVVTEQFDEAMAAFVELGEDVVVKPLFGSEGRGITRVSDPDIAYRVFRALEMGRYVYYLQEFIPHGSEDLRVFVVGNKVIAGMVRSGNSWKTNVSQGAKGKRVEISDEMCEMSLSAVRAVSADYAGVDLITRPDGRPTVIEINGIPGWRGLNSATGVDAAERLVAFALEGGEV
jgi:RimK family alpha-L-glutamate ligase